MDEWTPLPLADDLADGAVVRLVCHRLRGELHARAGASLRTTSRTDIGVDRERERDASACMRRHHNVPLAPMRRSEYDSPPE